jgi:hypothetical protein
MKPTIQEATIQKMVNEELADNQRWVEDFKKKHGRLPHKEEFFAHRKEIFEQGKTLTRPEDFMRLLEDLGVEWT